MTPETVEAVARAIVADRYGQVESFDDLSENQQAQWLKHAKAAILALREQERPIPNITEKEFMMMILNSFRRQVDAPLIVERWPYNTDTLTDDGERLLTNINKWVQSTLSPRPE